MHDQVEPEQDAPAEESLPDDYIAADGTGPEDEAIEQMIHTESASSEDIDAAEAPAPEPEPATEVETEVEPAADTGPAPKVEAAPEIVSEAESAPDSETTPEVVEAAVITTGDMPAGVTARVAWWPFLLLVAFWVALAGAASYFLTRTTDVPAFQHEYYPFIVLAGVALTALGPVLAIVTWAFSPKDGERGAQFVTSLVRAAAITLFGVLMWWGVLVAVDALRLGLIRL